MHWVASSNIGGNVTLFDSMAGKQLTTSLEYQVAAIYKENIHNDVLTVTCVTVQQQDGSVDCGLFSIAFLTNILSGSKSLIFDQSKMREHLVSCFEEESMISFPMLEHTDGIRLSRKKTFKIKLFCSCQMPESVDSNMVECEKCLRWYHFKCVGIVDNPKSWSCSNCK